MGRFIDLTGQRFGRLTVVGKAENSKNGKAAWNCICDCGRAVVVVSTQLRRGKAKSCGCLKNERLKEAQKARKKYNIFRVEGNIVYVKLSNSDKEMITDLDIWESAREYCWNLDKKRGYVCAYVCGQKKMKFHVYAFRNRPEGLVCDHINGNKLDNRRVNIRFVSQGQNVQNRGKGKNNTSGHTGIRWDDGINKWRAEIQANRKRIYLGSFPELQDAISAREAAEIKYFGEYRRK